MTDMADFVILNGKVMTMDDGAPRAEAVAIRGGNILAVGSTAEIRGLAGSGTRIIDAQGWRCGRAAR